MLKIKQIKKIKGAKVNLIPLKKTDIEIIRKWRNQNRQYFFDKSFISKKQQTQWYTKVYSTNPYDLIFIIQTAKGNLIGTISLCHIDPQKKEAEYVRMLIGNKRYRKKGYAKDASIALLNYAFTKMKLKRIYLSVIKTNINAIMLYRYLGFKKDKQKDGVIYMSLRKQP